MAIDKKRIPQLGETLYLKSDASGNSMYLENNPSLVKALNMEHTSRLMKIIAIYIGVFSCILASGQQLNWANRTGGSFDDHGVGLCVDNSGNVYTLSSCGNGIDLGNGPITVGGSRDVLLMKHNQSGQLLWYKTFGGSSNETPSDLCLDPAGNIYVTGAFGGTMVAGPDTLIAQSYDEVFIIKIDATGQNILWGRHAGSNVANGPEIGNAIKYSTIDNSIVVTGSIVGNTSFGSFIVSGASGFLTKLDVNGNWLWALGLNSTSSGSGLALDIESNGEIYVSATATSVMRIIKYKAWGTMIWMRTASIGYQHAISLNLDHQGNLVIAGSNYLNSSNFAGLQITSPLYNRNGFVIKMDTSGAGLWCKIFETPASSAGCYAAFNNSGEIVVTGIFKTTIYTDTTIIADIYASEYELFICKLSPAGTLMWIKQLGTDLDDYANDLEVSNNNIYIHGIVEGLANPSFAPISFPASAGNSDIILAQISDCSPPSTIVLPWSTVICEGDSFSIFSLTNSSNYSYMWLHNGIPTNYTSPAINNIGTLSSSGSYAIQITNNGCTYTSKYVGLFVQPNPYANINLLNYGAPCNRDSILLDADSLPGISYQWMLNGLPIPGAIQHEYSADTTGSYELILTSNIGCTDTLAPIIAYVGPTPLVNAWTASDSICQGGSVNLYASGAVNYSWTPSSTINSPASSAPIATPSVSTTYMVIGTTTNCSDTAYVSVFVNIIAAPVIYFNGTQLWTNQTGVSYQWYLNGNPYPGATSQYYSPPVVGSWSLEITDSIGCSATSTTISIVGIEESAFDDITVFPNPSSDYFFIQSNEPVFSWIVTDQLGNVIIEHNSSATNTSQIDLSSEKPGLYFAVINCDDKIYYFKIVKSN